jgi:hypothetical protein
MHIEGSPRIRPHGKSGGAAPGSRRRRSGTDRRKGVPSRQLWAFNVAVVLVVGLAAAKFVSSYNNQPDPHYVTARDLVEQYEFGRPSPVRNYEHNIYKTALNELSLVDPDSVSAVPAHELRSLLEKNIADFRAARQDKRQRESENQRKVAMRAAAHHQARTRSRLTPEPTYEVECGEGSDDDH